MTEMPSPKQLTGDLVPPSSSQHAEVPLGTAGNSSGGTNPNDLASVPWSLAHIQKLNVHELYTQQRQALRPWMEFFNTQQFKLPANIRAGGRRIVANLEHFQTNYFIVIAILSIYCVITTPALLFVLLAMGAGCYLVGLKNRESQLVIMGRHIPLTQQYLAVACLCIPLLLMVGAGSAIFWILGNIGASLFVIVLHALFHQTPNQEAFGVQMEEV